MKPPVLSQTNSSDYYDEDDSDFLEALQTVVLPGDDTPQDNQSPDKSQESQESEYLEPPPPTQPSLKRRRLEAYEERHSAQAELDDYTKNEEIYGAAHFGAFGEYMHRKRAKLQIQNAELEEGVGGSIIFKGLAIYVSLDLL
jgi:DNA repair protein REV1